MALNDIFKEQDGDCVGCSAPQASIPPPTTNAQWFINANGYWQLGDYVSSYNARGLKGEKGSAPYIGTNGNWWIENQDLGVPASGNVTVDMPSPESATDIFE